MVDCHHEYGEEEVQALLSKLPDDCSLEDIQYHLYVIEKVNNGLDAPDPEGTVSQEQVEQRLGKWLIECVVPTSY